MRPVLAALLLALVCVSGSLPLVSMSQDGQSLQVAPVIARPQPGPDGPALLLGPAKPMTSTRSAGLYNGRLNYDDVLLVVNNRSALSLQIGDYFKQARGISELNVCHINVSANEVISSAEFATLRSQVEDYLTGNNLTDKIDYIVMTEGCPLKYGGSGGYTYACVDSELALILGPYQSSIGGDYWVENPYFGEEKPFSRAAYGIYLVNRLTGYTWPEIKGLIDNASVSLNVTGKCVLDVDPGKDGSPGYKIGNDWLRGANASLVPKGYDVLLDETNTFVSGQQNVSMYGSWGSNDGHWWNGVTVNAGMETDSSPADGVPDNWAYVNDVGTWSRTNVHPQSGTWSAKCNRTVTGSSASYIYQDYTVTPGLRYYVTGMANLSGVSTEGGVYLMVQGLDASNNVVYTYNGSKRTGTTGNWVSLNQAFFEAAPNIVTARVAGVLSKSKGEVCFDSICLYGIRPHNTWVPGSIAETFVSTGGRSFDYGTEYGQSLVADIIRDGASGVKGYVYEPFLSAIAHPNILFDRYTDGYDMAESYYMASEFLSWQDVVVGDPKMCPYFYQRPDVYVDRTSTLVDDPIVVQGQPLAFSSIMRRSLPAIADDPTATIRLMNATNPDIWSLNTTYDMSAVSSVYVNTSIPTAQLLGDYDIVITVDSRDKVRECNEGNNTWTISAKVIKGPTILSANASNSVVFRGQTVTVSINVTDPQTPYDQLNVTSKYRASGLPWTNLSMSPQAAQGLWSAQLYIPIGYPLGYYDLEFNLTNGFGLGDHLQTPSAFSVLNNAPVITGMTIEPKVALRNGSCELRVNCLDVEDSVSNMTAQMRYSLDGTTWAVITNISRSAGAFVGRAEFSKLEAIGDVDFKAKICDSDGVWSKETYLNGSFSIVNECPGVESISVSKDIAERGESVDIWVTVLDLETQASELNLTLEYKKGSQWNALPVEYKDDEGVFRTSLAIGKDFELRPISFRAFVKDPSGASCMRYLNDSVLVRNSPPQVETFTAGKAMVLRGEGLNISMTCTDYEDPIGLLTAECEYTVGNASTWTPISPLTRTDNGFIATLTVPTTSPLADMTFRMRPFDKDTYGMVNQAWEYPAEAVKVVNNVPSAPMLSVPASVNSSKTVSIDVIVLTSDAEDAALTVFLNWSLDGSVIGGGVNLSAVSKGQYGGKINFDLPGGAGPFYVSYQVTVTDKDGGDSIATYPHTTKVSKTGGSSGDDDTSDDDTTDDYTMVYLGLGGVILVLVALIAIVAFVMLRRRRGEDEANAEAVESQSHHAHPAPSHSNTPGQAPVYSKPPTATERSKGVYGPAGPSENAPVYDAPGQAKPQMSQSRPVLSKPKPSAQLVGPAATPEALVSSEDAGVPGDEDRSGPELEQLTEEEPLIDEGPPAEEVEFDELDELVDFDDEETKE